MPVSSPGCSKGDAVPLRYAPGSGETGSDNPLSSARRTRPRRRGAGRGVKVRQSWTFTENFMRRTAARLSCLFCRRQNAAGDCALRARKARLACLSLSPYGRKFPHGNFRTTRVLAKSKHRLSEKRSLSTGLTGFLLFSCPHDMIVLKMIRKQRCFHGNISPIRPRRQRRSARSSLSACIPAMSWRSPATSAQEKPPSRAACLRGLGYTGRVTSPTFAIANEYHTDRADVAHFDLYRILDGEGRCFEIGFDEYLDGSKIVLIEWSENAADILPDRYKTVHIQYGTSENDRSGHD